MGVTQQELAQQKRSCKIQQKRMPRVASVSSNMVNIDLEAVPKYWKTSNLLASSMWFKIKCLKTVSVTRSSDTSEDIWEEARLYAQQIANQAAGISEFLKKPAKIWVKERAIVVWTTSKSLKCCDWLQHEPLKSLRHNQTLGNAGYQILSNAPWTGPLGSNLNWATQKTKIAPSSCRTWQWSWCTWTVIDKSWPASATTLDKSDCLTPVLPRIMVQKAKDLIKSSQNNP